MKKNNEVLGMVGIVVLFFVCLGIGWVGYSYCEARAYNNITGANVKTLDAMFVELRVQESAGNK